jgi:branched-chain amino acid transport system ATP-binding protein
MARRLPMLLLKKYTRMKRSLMPIWVGGKELLLEVKGLTVYYGTVKALENVSFDVDEREIVALIGPNGAGKSTALKAVTGVLDPAGGHIKSGEILFEQESIKGLRTDELVFKGLSLVPEGRRVFATMTVLENLEMGAYTVGSGRSSVFREKADKVFEIFPILKDRIRQKAGTLSSGEQQMLAIARSLMLKPKLLLADEPSLGLSPNFVDLIFEKLIEINEDGTAILIVEQNALMALEVCQRGYVFQIGSIALEGEKESLINNEDVKRAFLGA